MAQLKVNHPSHESSSNKHSHLLCWKSVLGGLAVTILSFLILTSLGAGVAGFTAEGMIQHERGGSALATGAGLWLGLSVVISLFCGSFFTMRISRFVTSKVGVAHGMVVASVFFLLLVLGTGRMIGGLAVGFGRLAEGAGAGAAKLSENPTVQDTMNTFLGNTPLKSTPNEVAQGLVVRLSSGDVEGAKNYYAYQSGLSRSDVDAKINQLKNDFDATTKRVAEDVAHAVGDTGLSLFVVFVVGLIAAALGGRFGALSNTERPFVASEERMNMPISKLQSERGSVVPYLFGWLLGVPVSILVLIALLRSIF